MCNNLEPNFTSNKKFVGEIIEQLRFRSSQNCCTSNLYKVISSRIWYMSINTKSNMQIGYCLFCQVILLILPDFSLAMKQLLLYFGVLQSHLPHLRHQLSCCCCCLYSHIPHALSLLWQPLLLTLAYELKCRSSMKCLKNEKREIKVT